LILPDVACGVTTGTEFISFATVKIRQDAIPLRFVDHFNCAFEGESNARAGQTVIGTREWLSGSNSGALAQ